MDQIILIIYRNENISTANTSKGIAAQNKAIHKGLLHIKNIEIEDENGELLWNVPPSNMFRIF